MAHFAEINESNEVVRVIVVDSIILHDGDMVEREQLGIDFLNDVLGGNTWVQTSYHGSFRKNFAGVGYTYDSSKDAFIAPKSYDSWTLNDDTCRWEPPVAMPDNGTLYTWDEESQQWIEE